MKLKLNLNGVLNLDLICLVFHTQKFQNSWRYATWLTQLSSLLVITTMLWYLVTSTIYRSLSKPWIFEIILLKRKNIIFTVISWFFVLKKYIKQYWMEMTIKNVDFFSRNMENIWNLVYFKLFRYTCAPPIKSQKMLSPWIMPFRRMAFGLHLQPNPLPFLKPHLPSGLFSSPQPTAWDRYFQDEGRNFLSFFPFLFQFFLTFIKILGEPQCNFSFFQFLMLKVLFDTILVIC